MDRRLILLKAGSFSMYKLDPLLLLHWKLLSNSKILKSSTASMVHCIQLVPHHKIFCLSGFLDLKTMEKSQRDTTDQQRSCLTCKIFCSGEYLCIWAKLTCALSWSIYHMPDSHFLSPSRCTASHKFKLIMWHVCWKPELWNRQRQPLLGNGSANTPVAR
jgi:hypothetical protein